MKTLRRLCAAMILSLTLAVSVLAGHIETPGVIPPPPTSTTTSTANVMTSILLTILGLT